jgi:RsiW-degrading membrane proteinase PrsW (M82 family)
MNPVGIVIGLTPVLLFLFGLLLMDSFKLVPRRSILIAIVAGVAAAALSFFFNRFALESWKMPPATLSLYLAPAVEETAKALYLVVLIRMNRVGFMVDAGILGFAIGTGFALVENLYYAEALSGAGVLLWLIRGLGTAIMHGSSTAVVGIVTKNFVDRHPPGRWPWLLPGLGVAILAHSAFNHLAGNPMLATAFLLIVMPLLLFLVFEYSERATRDWLGSGLDLEMELLEQLMSGEVLESRVGQYLHTLREHFPGEVVADMLCLVRVQLELSTRAKGMLIARAAGLEVPADDTVRANFEELRYLERAIGPTGRMAIMPFLRTSRRDLWQFYHLRGAN